jgi:polysaccharide biosynthesis transport protein
MVAVQVAKAFASYGYRTLLVDADLRAPSVARRLNLEERQREEGSRRAPASAAAWFAAPAVDHAVAQVAAARGRRLDVVPQFRPARSDSAEMVKGFRDALRRWGDYDVVVVTSAPVSSEDGLALAASCTATVLVHDRRREERRRMLGVRRALLRRGGVLLGVVHTGGEAGAGSAVMMPAPGRAGTPPRGGR